MAASFLQESLDSTIAQIKAYEAAALAIAAAGGVEQYWLDTGQSNQRVTRAGVEKIQETLEVLYNRCVILETRLGINKATAYIRPAW